MIRYLYLFTELPHEEIDKCKNYSGNKINELKILLANEATKLLHGKEAAVKAQNTSITTFNEGLAGEELPSKIIKKENIDKKILLKDLLLEINFATSGSDFKRNLLNNAYRINNMIENNELRIISHADIINSQIKISFGKKKHFVLKIN